MCGINGFNWVDLKKIQAMNEAIKHRGPNGQGIYCDQSISVGQVRLAILDLSIKGHQPMGLNIKNPTHVSLIFTDEKLNEADIIIVFNGEIFNYQDIRQSLQKYPFESDCDTEVILKAYLEWGTDCVNRFNGMWAFVVYDKRSNIFFCSRDRLGEKPFYYYYSDGQFIFSSELKAILQHVELNINTIENLNQDALEFYFNSGFIPAPMSIFKKVQKLEARNNLIFNLSTKTIEKIWNYYEIPNYSPNYNKKQLIEEGRKLLQDSIKIRLFSDVPLGVFLSGGLDSSSIVATMAEQVDLSKLNTFSVGFEGKYDETPYINIVKNQLRTIHHHTYFNEINFQELMDDFVLTYDEPYGDYSGFALMFLAKQTKPFVTVVLGGDGGDEMFGGYEWHKAGSRLDLIAKIPKPIRKILANLRIKMPIKALNTKFNALQKACQMTLLEKHDFFAVATNYVKSPAYETWTREKFRIALEKGGNFYAEAFRVYDMAFFTIEDLYSVKVDRAAMQYALEVRCPFLDYRFIEFSQKIPTKWKQNSLKTKILMREIIRDLLPKSIVFRNKRGFHPPIDVWILNKKYQTDLQDALARIKKINSRIYDFFTSTIFSQNAQQDQWTCDFKIRLILFNKWWNTWILNNEH